MGFLERLKASPRINKVHSVQDIEEEAEAILRKYSDQNFSYTDAVSFVTMRTGKIQKVFLFGRHFSTAGFMIIP